MVWQTILIALFRVVWKERNARIFNAESKLVQEAFEEVKSLVFYWFLSCKEFKGWLLIIFLGVGRSV